MTESNRPTGAIARVLDEERLLEIGKQYAVQEYPELKARDLNHGPLPQMIFGVDRGKAAAIVNTEGVGSVQDENNHVDVYFRSDYTIFPVRIPLDALTDAVTETTIDLADGIRTFGARLDSNHYTWFRQYSGVI